MIPTGMVHNMAMAHTEMRKASGISWVEFLEDCGIRFHFSGTPCVKFKIINEDKFMIAMLRYG